MSLISVPRFARVLERYGARFLERVFAPDEIAYAQRKRHSEQHLASRFAAKCAGRQVLRAHGRVGLRLRDLEVRRKKSGEPVLVWHGADDPPLRSRVSMTHDPEMALASLYAEHAPLGR